MGARLAGVAMIAALASLALPSPASATTISLSGTTLLVAADPGEHNDLYVVRVFAGSPATSQFYITDQGIDAAMTAGAGCVMEVASTSQGYCPTDGITDVKVVARDQDDKVFIQTTGLSPAVLIFSGSGNDRVQGGANTGETINGGTGRDLLRGGGFADSDPLDNLIGGRGRDKLFGEGGPDKLFAKDHFRDKVIDCGEGDDRHARRDRFDPKPKSC